MHTLKALLKSWWIQAAIISSCAIWTELVCATCMLPEWNQKGDGGFPTHIPDLVFIYNSVCHQYFLWEKWCAHCFFLFKNWLTQTYFLMCCNTMQHKLGKLFYKFFHLKLTLPGKALRFSNMKKDRRDDIHSFLYLQISWKYVYLNMLLMVAIQGSQYLFPSYWVIAKAKLNFKNAQYILYTHNSRLNIDLHGVFFMSLAMFLFPHQCPIVTSLCKAAYNWKYFLQLKSLLLTKRKNALHENKIIWISSSEYLAASFRSRF